MGHRDQEFQVQENNCHVRIKEVQEWSTDQWYEESLLVVLLSLVLSKSPFYKKKKIGSLYYSIYHTEKFEVQ